RRDAGREPPRAARAPARGRRRLLRAARHRRRRRDHVRHPPAQRSGAPAARGDGMRRAVLVLALLAVPGAARGQSEAGEYDTSITAWNGLSTLDALARGMGF